MSLPRRHHASLCLAIAAVMALSSCGSDAVDTPQVPATPSTTQPPADPFDSSAQTRTWQEEVVTSVIDVGRGRSDVDDAAIVAALTATYAETSWSIRFIRRNLLGWSYSAFSDPINSPDSDSEVQRAVNVFYDRLLADPSSGDPDADIATVALEAQVGDTTKRIDYYTDRPCDGETRRPTLCTPDSAATTYREAVPKAEAAFERFGS